jgi:hypothetical protein
MLATIMTAVTCVQDQVKFKGGRLHHQLSVAQHTGAYSSIFYLVLCREFLCNIDVRGSHLGWLFADSANDGIY